MIVLYIGLGLIVLGLIGLITAVYNSRGGGPILLGDEAGGIFISRAVIALGVIIVGVIMLLHAAP